MPLRRALAALTLAGAALVGAACAEPPESEVEQAQGAIDAARAAGAEIYATDELAAAVAALTSAREAIDLRDYRLALSHALDSRERAQNAAKQAADGQAAARVEADRALAGLTDALTAARTSLKAAEAARVPTRTLAPPRRTLTNADERLQEARTAFEGGDYRAAVTIVSETLPLLTAASEELQKAATTTGRRRAS
jgi:hypothetical protein